MITEEMYRHRSNGSSKDEFKDSHLVRDLMFEGVQRRGIWALFRGRYR